MGSPDAENALCSWMGQLILRDDSFSVASALGDESKLWVSLDQIFLDRSELQATAIRDSVSRELLHIASPQHPLRSFKPKHSTVEGAELGKRQRRFPGNTSTILLHWLNDHANKPYPSGQEMLELARATNLSKCQIQQWFVNARRRMVSHIASHMLAQQEIMFSLKVSEVVLKIEDSSGHLSQATAILLLESC